MPVPSSGQLRLRADIALEVDGSATGTNVSLRALSSTAGFSTPDAMSEFYGYSAAPPIFIEITDDGGFSVSGGDGTSYTQRIVSSKAVSDENIEQEVSIYGATGQSLRIDLYRQFQSNTSASIIGPTGIIYNLNNQAANVSTLITLPNDPNNEYFIYLYSEEDDGSTRTFSWSIYVDPFPP